jgi:Putative addiction module component
MRQRATAVLHEALDLTDEERAEVAGALLESLEQPAGNAGEGQSAGQADLAPDLAAAWRREVAGRVAALEAGEVESTPWEAIRDRFLARLSEQRPG